MRVLQSITFILKFGALGAIAGFLILFFMPNSQLAFNWQSANEAWSYYQAQVNRKESQPDTIINPPAPFSFSHAVDKASPSVVTVNVYRPKGIRNSDQLGNDERIVEYGIGVGSGVIFNEAGYIVTNYHVVANGERVSIAFPDGRKRFAELVGVDVETDLAVLKTLAKGLIPATMASLKSVKTGDLVIAIGSPFGMDQSASLGIVSAITYAKFEPRIQTDAAINSGNSGGALINANGDVIGINHSKVNIGSSTGVNYAIPIDIVQYIVNRIIDDGRVRRNWLGIGAVELLRTHHESRYPNIEFGSGFFVGVVEKNSPAEQSGVKLGDFITQLDGQEISGIESFYRIFTELPIGSTATVTVIREDQRLDLSLKLREKGEGDFDVVTTSP